MQRLGFIHDMMDVKVLILFVTARCGYPLTCQEVYELCYQDDCLSYFDVCTAIPELTLSGHLKEVESEKFTDFRLLFSAVCATIYSGFL